MHDTLDMTKGLIAELISVVGKPLSGLSAANRGRTMMIAPRQCVPVVDSKSTRFDQGQAIGVTLNIVQAPNNESQAAVQNDAYLPLVRARLMWGVGQASFTAECDFRLGTQLVLPAEIVRVDAFYEDGWLSPPGDPPTSPLFKVGATLSYGARSCCTGVTFTVPVYVVPNDYVRIQIPQYATSFNALKVGGNGGAFTAKVFGAGSAAAVYYEVAAGMTNDEIGEAFVLFGGARFVEIQNPTLSPIAALLVFNLAL